MEEGIYTDVSAADYRKVEAVSASFLKSWFRKTPKHGKSWVDEPEDEDEKSHFIVGTLAHHLILQPDEPFPSIVVPPATYPAPAGSSLVKQKKVAVGDHVDWSWNSSYCKLWRTNMEAQGKTVLTNDDRDAVYGMAEAVKNHPDASRYFSHPDGRPEVSIFWKDRETGLDCKARLDWVPPGNVIPDLKTCRSNDPRQAEQNFFDLGYHIQAAFYKLGWNTLMGKTDPKTLFTFITVENSKPFDVVTFECDPWFLKEGSNEVRRLLNTWAECVAKNNFPGRSDTALKLQLPLWKRRELGLE